MSDTTLRRMLTKAALEIGAILNTVEGDDERDELHGHVEKVINDELYAGSVNREEAARTVVEFSDRKRRACLFHVCGGEVVDLFSRKVQP